MARFFFYFHINQVKEEISTSHSGRIMLNSVQKSNLSRNLTTPCQCRVWSQVNCCVSKKKAKYAQPKETVFFRRVVISQELSKKAFICNGPYETERKTKLLRNTDSLD